MCAALKNNKDIKLEPNKVRQWLVDWVAKELKVQAAAIDDEEKFINLGLSSRQAISLAGDLEDWLGREVSPSIAWDYPSIAALANHVANDILT